MTTLTSPGERLKHIRKLIRLSRNEIAEKYKISPNTLKFWESAKTDISEKALNECIEIYRAEGMLFNKEWILTGFGIPPTSFIDMGKKINRQSSVQLIDSNANDFLLIQEVKFFKDLYIDGTIMIVPNDDMLPFYKAGDYVAGRWLLVEKIDQAISKDCIIQLSSGEKYFRRLVKDGNSHYNITCLNPMDTRNQPVIYDVEIISIAPIIWHRKIIF